MRVNSLAGGFICREHDPEKWLPVFPRDKREAFARRSCSNKKIERDDDSKEKSSRSRSKAAKKPAARVTGSLAFSFGRNFPTARGRIEAKRSGRDGGPKPEPDRNSRRRYSVSVPLSALPHLTVASRSGDRLGDATYRPVRSVMLRRVQPDGRAGQGSRPDAGLCGDLAAARGGAGRLLPWVPIAFGAGIAFYFGADHEPVAWVTAVAAIAFCAAAFLLRRQKIFPIAVLIAAMAAGFAVATWKTARVAHGVLARPMYSVQLSGFVEARDIRERTDRFVLRVAQMESPRGQIRLERVRLSVRKGTAPAVGSFVELKARLQPPTSSCPVTSRDVQEAFIL